MHPLCAIEMSGEVAIAKAEPRFAVETLERCEHVERLALESPTLRAIHRARERIGDGVDVGRDAKPVEDFVVAGVDNDGQPRGIYSPNDSPDELSRTHSPR